MRIAVFAGSGSMNGDKPYYSGLRSEGRFTSNIGIGLAKLGHEIDIVYTVGSCNGQITDRVKAIPFPGDGEYDYAISLSSPDKLIGINSKNHVLINANQDFTLPLKYREDHNSVIIATSYAPVYDMLKDDADLDLKFLPSLYPDPLMYNSFLDLRSNLKKHVRIFAQTNPYGGVESWKFPILKNIAEVLIERGHTVEFRIQSQGNLGQEYLNQVSCNYTYINHYLVYDELCEEIRTCDLSILFINSGSASASQYDNISMGVPSIVMSLAPENVREHPFLSYLSVNDTVFKYDGDDYGGSEALTPYMHKYFDNIAEYNKSYREDIKDFDFVNWKKHMEVFFNE